MPNGDSSKKLFTHKMWEGYTWVPFYHFDLRDNTDAFTDNVKANSFNADVLSKEFHDKMQEMISHYRGDQILLQFGNDFAYINAFGDFTNIDRMIDYINKHYSDYYEIRYSTPSEYIDAVAK
jgi:lysosomal alpha-mannosidase